MKKEVMDILQNELVFDRLSGSAGNITAVSIGNKHYFRKKVKTQCPNTERQQTHLGYLSMNILDTRANGQLIEN